VGLIKEKCSRCGKIFDLRFSYQVTKTHTNENLYFCSVSCKEPSITKESSQTCSFCGKETTIATVVQIATSNNKSLYFCGYPCRQNYFTNKPSDEKAELPIRKIALLNHKGGTAKTTTAVNLAAGLATKGKRVLLIDLDSQGHVGVCLGITHVRSMYHLLVEDAELSKCIVSARPNLDVILANESMASAEIKLVNFQDREHVLSKRLCKAEGYDYIIIDCPPSLSLLNQNALIFAHEVFIPVSCDYLSLVGVKHAIKTIKTINQLHGNNTEVTGVIPTFYDVRNSISFEAVNSLTKYFNDKVLPPIRINTKLKEAPSHQKTIFEYDPESRGASDYNQIVTAVISMEETVIRSLYNE